MFTVINGDFRSHLAGLKPDLIFADPPDNIKLNYGEYNDFLERKAYLELLEDLVAMSVAAPHAWISFNSRWTIPMGVICDRVEEHGTIIKPCVQTFTFGQHNRHDLGNNHRPLWRLSQPGAPLYPDAVRVESERQKMGDKRANPNGRVPGDVFDFPRVTGNSKQRRSWHPTQLHEDLVERCILLCTKEGDHVVDPFGGTGTTLRVCKRLNRRCTLIEIDADYCEKIKQENLTA